MWNFFATSHGKSTFDGIGGTATQLATNKSLMATEKNQILMPLDLFDWASKNVCNIDFIYISAEEITEHCQKNNLNERYELPKVEKGLGTRSSQWCSLKRLLKSLPMISLHLESTLLVSMIMSATWV